MKKRILVIDDDEKSTILARTLLEIAGFEVLEAKDAKTGIAIACKEKPDVILMEVRFIDMQGCEVVRILRQDKKTNCIPVIFVTAFVIGEEVDEVRALSGCGFISKPIDTSTFADEVSKYSK